MTDINPRNFVNYIKCAVDRVGYCVYCIFVGLQYCIDSRFERAAYCVTDFRTYACKLAFYRVPDAAEKVAYGRKYVFNVRPRRCKRGFKPCANACKLAFYGRPNAREKVARRAPNTLDIFPRRRKFFFD